MSNHPSSFILHPFVDDTSGIAELEKRTAPKVRIVESIIIGAMVGGTFICVFIAVLTFIHFHK